jgi:hypothetical protein
MRITLIDRSLFIRECWGPAYLEVERSRHIVTLAQASSKRVVPAMFTKWWRARDRRIGPQWQRQSSTSAVPAMMRSAGLWIRCRKPEGPHTGAATDGRMVKRASIAQERLEVMFRRMRPLLASVANLESNIRWPVRRFCDAHRRWPLGL